MARGPEPFRFTLTAAEAQELEAPAGQGGHQNLHARLREQLANGHLDVELDDRELGELIRYMTRYGDGGFQGRLRRAFRRSLRELIDG